MTPIRDERTNPSRLLCISCFFIILLPTVAIGQERIDPRLVEPFRHTPIELRTSDNSAPNRIGVTDECDSDFDGAFIGAAIGVAPPTVLALVGETDDLGGAYAKAAVIGAVSGFLVGLALDSRNCTPPSTLRTR